MPPVLADRLAELRRRVRQALLAYGLSWVAGVVVGAILAACLTDWALHLDDAGVRAILGLSILGGGAWVAYRYLLVPLQVPLSNVDLALRIEARHPGFHDSLASSVQFLEGAADPRIGSPALQQAVVRETLGRLKGLDCADVVQTRGVRRVVIAALGVCLFATIVGGLDRARTSIALRRLFLPFSAPAWPRATYLRLLDAELEPLGDSDVPLQIVRGGVLELFAENETGRLPDKVTLEYRGEDGKIVSEAMRPLTRGGTDGKPRELALGHLSSVKGQVEFRAVGGDDDAMPWRVLRVIPPPVIDHLHVTLTPPPYSSRPVEEQPDGNGHVEGLVGTRVEIEATASKPLRRAMLQVRNRPLDSVELSDDARQLTASFVIAEAGTYSWWLELHDAEGFADAEPPRYDVKGLLDAEPEIRIDAPAADLQVTAEARVPIQAIARDDLGLREIRLVHRREVAEESEAAKVSLFDGQSRPREQTVDYLWSLSDLGLKGGDRVVFHVEATDDFDLAGIFPEGQVPPPHVGRSVSRVLTVISQEEKLQELAQRQAGLLDDLERAFKLQKQAREQVGDLQVQVEKAGKVRPADLDTLQRTEIGQREVAGQLAHPTTGLQRRARELVNELHANQLDDPQSERRLTEIAAELERLAGEHLPAIEQDLTQTRKLLQSETAVDPRASPTDSRKNRGEKRIDRGTPTPPSEKRPATRDAIPPADAEESPAERDEPKSEAAESPPPKQTARGEHDKNSRSSGDSRRQAIDRPETALKQVAENQDAVLDSLSEMLDELSQWRTEHDAIRELADLIKQQDDLNRKTGELGRRTLTKSKEQLPPQEQADLVRMAERQAAQAKQLEQLQSRMEEKPNSMSESNPAAAALLKDAADQARKSGVAAQMEEAAEQIGQNRMGEASRSQEQVLEKLRDLERTLNETRESDTETLVKKLRQAEQDLQTLRDREQELMRKVEQAENIADEAQRNAELERLRKEQQQLREETAAMARRLQRLQSRRPSAAAQRAAARMQQAQDDLEQGDQAEASREQQEAIDDLEQAQRELARDRRRAEEQLAREQLEKIAEELAAMTERQKAALDETRRLEAHRQSAGKLGYSQRAAVRDLTGVQRAIKEDTDRLVDKLSAAEVFAQALRGASRSLDRAVDRLKEFDTSADTQLAQENARRRFVDLNDALKEDPDGQPKQEEESQQGGGAEGQNAGPETDGIPALAQLKMLLALQREIFERTTRFQEIRAAGKPLTPEQQEEFEFLAKEQGELADLARNLTRLASEPEQPKDPADGGKPAENEEPKAP